LALLLHAALAQERLAELVGQMEQEAGPASPEAYDRVLAQWFVTDAIARSAAKLKRLAGMTDIAATIDAVVVAAGGGLILTSDPGDVRALADCVTDTRIRPVRVS
jgi:hypothetical protein